MDNKTYLGLTPEERKAYHTKEEADRRETPAYKARKDMDLAYSIYSELAQIHYQKYGKQTFSSIAMQLSSEKVDIAEKNYIQAFNHWQLIR